MQKLDAVDAPSLHMISRRGRHPAAHVKVIEGNRPYPGLPGRCDRRRGVPPRSRSAVFRWGVENSSRSRPTIDRSSRSSPRDACAAKLYYLRERHGKVAKRNFAPARPSEASRPRAHFSGVSRHRALVSGLAVF